MMEKAIGAPPIGRLGSIAWRNERAIVGALVMVAGALRFADIAGRGYWRDEVFSVDLVRLPFGAMLRGVARGEATPPLYYVVGWVWARVFGTSETQLRSLSALVGVLIVVAVYAAARSLVSRRAGVVAAALTATSPLLVWYGQEARSYELGLLFVAVSLAAMGSMLRSGVTQRSISLWALASCLALTTHYFTAFAVAPEALWLLHLSRLRGRRVVLVGIAVVAGAEGALMPLLLAQRGNPGWIGGRPLPRRVVEVPSQFLAGPQPSVAAVAVPLALLCLIGLWTAMRKATSSERRGAGVAASIGFAAVLLPLLLAVLGVDFFLARNMTSAGLRSS